MHCRIAEVHNIPTISVLLKVFTGEDPGYLERGSNLQRGVILLVFVNFTRFLAHLSRRLIGEPIIGYSWSGVRPSFTMLKDLLLQNRLANHSQILCGASLGRGNESLFAACGSHDQDGRHAHIW